MTKREHWLLCLFEFAWVVKTLFKAEMLRKDATILEFYKLLQKII